MEEANDVPDVERGRRICCRHTRTLVRLAPTYRWWSDMVSPMLSRVNSRWGDQNIVIDFLYCLSKYVF